MAKIKGKFISLAGRLMFLYEDQLKKADNELVAVTGKHWNELDPEGWYESSLFNTFMELYAEGSASKEYAIVTLGRRVYPTIKETSGLPENLMKPLDFLKYEAEGFLASHQGSDVIPRKFLKAEDRHVIVQASSPGYNPRINEGVYLGILEMCGVETGKVVQTRSTRRGDPVDEFEITW